MREIEIKVRVTDTSTTHAALDKIGIVLGAPKKQHDVVYGQQENGSFVHGGNWLRVRTEDDTKVIFTLKRSVTGELDSIEHETVVENAKEMTAIIGQLGYELYSDLTKIRRKAQYEGLEICFDEVPDLGTFLEVEKLCPDDVDLQAVRSELWGILKKLDLDETNEVTSGYDVMLRIAQGLGR